VNNHPFVFGRHIFMHNGVVTNFPVIKREIADLLSFDAFCNVFGSTDSEHAAALYMTYLTNGGSKETWQQSYSLEAMRTALIKTVIKIMELQERTLGSKRTPNALNFCTTDGTKLVAIRFRNHAWQAPPSLFWSEFAGRKLNTKFPGHPDSPNLVNENAVKGEDAKMGKHTIVASEPTTHDDKEWHLINANCALTVDENGVEKEWKIEYDPKLNAEGGDYDERVAAVGH
jgi:glutamine amidotransferase